MKVGWTLAFACAALLGAAPVQAAIELQFWHSMTGVLADQVTSIADEWTFARNPKSRDPNWKLVATEAGQ